MDSRQHRSTPAKVFIFNILILATLLLSACEGVAYLHTSTAPASTSTPSSTPPATQAVVNFRVRVPDSKDNSQVITLDILDEVTGLALNPARYTLRAVENGIYTISLPFPVGSILKYRFNLAGKTTAVEYTPLGDQVRYRLYHVVGPGQVSEVVAGWNRQIVKTTSGQISGKVFNQDTGDVIPGILIAAGGLQTLTNSDGSFLLEGLPEGIHNLVAYSLDGAYQSFQQGADVVSGMNTPAMIKLQAAKLVRITFTVTVPNEAIGAPIRLAGNLLQLGNTFADLSGGINTIASRMPVLAILPDGRYTITLDLPEGSDIRYKYTLGDGFWNAEQTKNGKFRLHQLIVPSHDQAIDDNVVTWKSGKMAPITFEVAVPENTPASDTISIQLNPYGWTEPLPMWSIGHNRWLYILFNPLEMVSSLRYRYCRNDQCGVADDVATQGENPSGWPVTVGLLPQSFQDEVKSWAWWNPSSEPTNIIASEIVSKSPAFITGVELQPGYHPSWQPRMLPMLQQLQKIDVNTIILSPSWTYSQNTSPILRLTPEQNPLWSDLVATIKQTNALGFKTIVFPQPFFSQTITEWWRMAPKDPKWWDTWFMYYRYFILHHADLCSRYGVAALVIGGEWLLPALPQGKLTDGSPSNVPENAENRWRQLLIEVRQRYKGTIIWVMPYPNGFTNPPSFLDLVDQLYVTFSSPIAARSQESIVELEIDFKLALQKKVQPLYNALNKPIMIGIGYPSVKDAIFSCISLVEQECLSTEQLDQPLPDAASIKIDLEEQVNIYNAILRVIDQEDWIVGVTTRGYYPPVSLQDGSRSINGKPAYDVLWYWYSKIAK
jgi:hypothetical protein